MCPTTAMLSGPSRSPAVRERRDRFAAEGRVGLAGRSLPALPPGPAIARRLGRPVRATGAVPRRRGFDRSGGRRDRERGRRSGLPQVGGGDALRLVRARTPAPTGAGGSVAFLAHAPAGLASPGATAGG